MSEPFIAEIRIFAGNFAPRNWAFCDGQLLPVSQNTALFSLVGTTYGGDGRSTLGLPNLQGRAPMHPGRGPGLTSRRLGQRGGSETVTLTEAQMPSHNHTARGLLSRSVVSSPQGNSISNSVGAQLYQDSAASQATLDGQTITNTGGGQAHNNMQPYLAINFIIALVGLYPSRD